MFLMFTELFMAHSTMAPYSRTAALNKDKLHVSVSGARSDGLQISWFFWSKPVQGKTVQQNTVLWKSV